MSLGYPSRVGERVPRNDFTQRWTSREAELASDSEARRAVAAAIAGGDARTDPVDAG
jgi:hypothetical protein